MHVKRGTANNAATVQAASKTIEALEPRHLLSGAGGSFLAVHMPMHARTEVSAPAISVKFNHGFSGVVHSHRIDPVHTVHVNDNSDRQTSGDFEISKNHWEHGGSESSPTIIIEGTPSSDHDEPYTVSPPDWADIHSPSLPPVQGYVPPFVLPPVGLNVTTPAGGTTAPHGDVPGTSSSTLYVQNPNSSGKSTEPPAPLPGDFQPWLLHPGSEESVEHAIDKSSQGNASNGLQHENGQTITHDTVRAGSPTSGPTVLGPAVVHPNATNVNAVAVNNGPIYVMPMASAPTAASESRTLEVAARGAKADVAALPTSVARSVMVAGAQFTFAFMADSELMARAMAALLPQSMEMADMASAGEVASIARSGVVASADVAAIAATLTAPKTLASAATAARAFFNIAPINATAMFSDALVSFANDFASLPQTPEPQSGSRRAWAITAAVIAVDAMLLGRWYLGRRKASKAATLFNDGPAFA